MKMRMILMFVFVVLGVASIANATAPNWACWTDLGGDNLWTTVQNWDVGIVPTGPLYNAYMYGYVSPGAVALVDSTVDANIVDFVIFNTVGDTMTLQVTGGSFTATGLLKVGNDSVANVGTAIVDVDGGVMTVDDAKVGTHDLGKIDISGGQFTTNRSLNLAMAAGGTGQVIVSGGTLNVVGTGGVGFYLANGGDASLTMSGGTVNTTWLSAAEGGGTAVWTMTDGIFNASETVLLGFLGAAQLNLLGGVINCNNFGMAWGGGPAVRSVNIEVGTLIINGDKRATIQTYINNGWIKAYGGARAVVNDYGNINAGKTTVRAATAGNAAPDVNAGADVYTWLNGGTRSVTLAGTLTDDGVPVASTVKWTIVSQPDEVNEPATFTPDPATDLDSVITMTALGTYVLQLEAYDTELTDVDTMTINVYANACEAAKAKPEYATLDGDINDDCVVNFVDFALLAENWLKSSALPGV